MIGILLIVATDLLSRGLGEHELIQGAIPEWLALAVALLTQLGDIWFLALLLAACYWLEIGDRTDIATVAGVWLAGLGLYRGLKEIFAFPRPTDPLLEEAVFPIVVQQVYEATAFATGYGFPSGHAVNTTIVYLSLAAVLTVGTRRKRFGVAAGVVAAVSFSRVALGVHYLVDVVAGIGVGLLLLATMWVLAIRRPTARVRIAFAAAIVLGGFYLVASAAALEAIVVLVVSLAVFAGFQFLEPETAA